MLVAQNCTENQLIRSHHQLHILDLYLMFGKTGSQHPSGLYKAEHNRVPEGIQVRQLSQLHSLYKTFFAYSIHHVIEELKNLFSKKELSGVKILLAVGDHSYLDPIERYSDGFSPLWIGHIFYFKCSF
jgi:hypothetical protein